MNPDPLLLILFLVLLGIGGVGLANRRRARREHERGRGAAAADVLADAELCALQDAWDEANVRARAVVAAAGSSGDPETLRALALAKILLAEGDAIHGRIEPARRGLEEVRALRKRLPASDPVDGLRFRERHVEAVLALRSPDGPAGREIARKEIEATGSGAGAAIDPALLFRRARLAAALARREMEDGSWPRARAMLERSIQLAEGAGSAPRPAARTTSGRDHWVGEIARSHASQACTELGIVLTTTGHSDEAAEWLDRAVTIAEPTTTPAARFAFAHALVVRAAHEPAAKDPTAHRRRRWLERARDAALEHDWPPGLALAARAEIRIGVLLGSGAEAELPFRSAASRLEGLVAAGARELRAEAGLLLGQCLEPSGRTEEACREYRRAFEAGRADSDPDARRYAAFAAAHLHRLLRVQERTTEAREVLLELESLAPTLAPGIRPLVVAIAARGRGQQLWSEGDPAGAESSFQQALEIAVRLEGAEARDLERQVQSERGHLALAEDAPDRAERRFREALEVPAGTRPEPVDLAERAELHLGLARSLEALDRPREAADAWRRAFEAGRDSGSAGGRATAAVAALALGDREDDDEEVRRTWHERAASFGRLSGTPRGQAVLQAVEERRGPHPA